jgi:Domain of unknown function (DUF5666)
MINGWQRAALLACCGLIANACDTGSPTAGIDRGGLRTPVVTQGPITAFGSIVVNGVHYDIVNAAVQIDGSAATGADLQLGQQVTVVGERDDTGSTGVADSVFAETSVRGQVESVDTAAGEIVVLRQRVLIDTGTVLGLGSAPASIASINVGDWVQVSGFLGAGGVIEATRVEPSSADRGYRIFGIVANLDTAGLSFNLGNLVVRYSSALVIEGFPSGQPVNGDQVVVGGSARGTAGELIATSLRRVEDVFRRSSGDSEVEGLITRFVSPQDFDVAGSPTTTTVDSVYEGGSQTSLALNVKVSVAGAVNDAGVIVARKIEIEDGGEAEGSGVDH